jgi:hypothetical protein
VLKSTWYDFRVASKLRDPRGAASLAGSVGGAEGRGKAGGGDLLGRLVVELRRAAVPVAAQNFVERCCRRRVGRSFCGHRRHGYAGSTVHRIVPGFALHAGDYEHGDGTGTRSAFGPAAFADEAAGLATSHGGGCGPGILSMANALPCASMPAGAAETPASISRNNMLCVGLVALLFDSVRLQQWVSGTACSSQGSCCSASGDG